VCDSFRGHLPPFRRELRWIEADRPLLDPFGLRGRRFNPQRYSGDRRYDLPALRGKGFRLEEIAEMYSLREEQVRKAVDYVHAKVA